MEAAGADMATASPDASGDAGYSQEFPPHLVREALEVGTISELLPAGSLCCLLML